MTAAADPLVSTEWLAERLGDPKVKVLDASFKMPGVTPRPRDDYLAAHLPGAVYFDVEEVCDRAQELPHMYPDAAQFARDVAALGVSSDDTVVVYDAGGWVAAPRVWWMFLSFGHRDIRILDGGLKKWLAEGRPTESGAPSPEPGTFTAKLDPGYLRSKQQMVANLDRGAEQVIDARAAERFEGRVPEPRPGLRAGHIPGSRNLPYNELFDGRTGLMKSRDDLRAAFEKAAVDLERPIVTSCGSGVSALVVTLALYRLGVHGTALYDGSWSEWGLADGPPIATGPA